MPASELMIEKDPALEDVAYLEDRLYEYNVEVTGITDGQLIGVFIRDDAGKILAGIGGNTWGECCEIKQLWVDKSVRRRGLGSRLLAAVEAEARRMQCTQVVVATHSFQAPEFYKQHGYSVMFSINDMPRGHQHIYLRKTLQP